MDRACHGHDDFFVNVDNRQLKSSSTTAWTCLGTLQTRESRSLLIPQSTKHGSPLREQRGYRETMYATRISSGGRIIGEGNLTIKNNQKLDVLN